MLVIAVNHWLRAKHERKLTGVIFVDMSKAFDCVKHIILAQELSYIGVGGTVQLWFTNYLSERLQRVVVGGNCSRHGGWSALLGASRQPHNPAGVEVSRCAVAEPPKPHPGVKDPVLQVDDSG